MKQPNGHVAGQSRVLPPMVPLASLLAYELKNDVEENPILRCGLALQPRKGEDFALINTNCQRLQDDASSTFAVFGVSFFSFLKVSIVSCTCCVIEDKTTGDYVVVCQSCC